MTQRSVALALMIVGLLINVIGKIPSIRETWMNAALTGASVAVIAVGLFRLWKARTPAGK